LSLPPLPPLIILFVFVLIKPYAFIPTINKAEKKNAERGVSKEKKKEYEACEKAHNFLVETKKDISAGQWTPYEIEVLNTLQLLTAKPVVYLVNLSKKDFIRKQNKWLDGIKEFVTKRGMNELVIPFSVAHEEELLQKELAEGKKSLFDFFKENPAQTSALPNIIRKGYHALNLIHYFTCGKGEVRGWTVKKGSLAPKAAGVIHTDFEKGFIKAEVYSFKDLKELGSPEEVKAKGKHRMEGKNYVVQDGDIIFFKFNN
jgi:obg-like ATPase 1